MHFCVRKPRTDCEPRQLRALHLSLNTPVIAISELPVGPARAGIAVCEDPTGAFGLEIAIRALRTGQVIAYAPAAEPFEPGDAALDAALAFAEGMGFLFDDDELASPGRGPAQAAALWSELVEEGPQPAPGPLGISALCDAARDAVIAGSSAILSRFRFPAGTIAAPASAVDAAGDPGPPDAAVPTPHHSRIRLLSRF
jgi:hypothetical protein